MSVEPLTLHTYKIPCNLSPRSAKDAALALTAHRRMSDLVRYAAMALHYLSWTQRETTLSDHRGFLAKMTAESGSQLLEVLSFPATYALRGERDLLPGQLVRRSQTSAIQWRRSLDSNAANVLKLHRRFETLLERHLSSGVDSQRMLVAELQVAIFLQSEEPDEGSTVDVEARHLGPYGAEMAHATPGAPEEQSRLPNRGTRVFGGAAEALAFLMQHSVIVTSPGMRHPGGEPRAPGAAVALGANGSPPALTDAPSLAELPQEGARQKAFSPGQAFGILQRMPPPGPNEGNSQQRRILEAMAADSGIRALTETPEGAPLAELYVRFPHFSSVLDFVVRNLALAACGETGRPVRVPPVLLRSEPGIGKTYFAQELAKALSANFVERDLSVVTEAFVISGMDSSWKGSKPGIVFDALVHGQTANPVICLNEIDKARVSGTHNSPLAALYTLLEPASAERFQDEFVPVRLDASAVIWVLTANDGHIPDPILSRTEIFDIPRPTQAQCRAIAVSIWESICAKSMPRGHGFSQQLPDEVLNAVSALSPRVMRRILMKAVGEAAFSGRKEIFRSDLDAASQSSAAAVRSIGFTN